jgi:crotonobetainyl-CoA:carnitine CoA-transferase CaiB-like acyl-CoA transferase
MALLQNARIPAGVARSIRALLDDPHLRARNFWCRIERPFVGDYLSGTSFYREDGRPAPIRNGAPTLGEHNVTVLAGRLGLSQDKINALSAAGIIGTEAVPK